MFFKKIIETGLGALLAEGELASTQSHPNFMKPFLHMCDRHGIQHPPAVHITPYTFPSSAITQRNAIIIGGDALLLPENEMLYVGAHELSHVLAGHTGASIKINEHMADRLAVQLTVSHEGALARVERGHAHEMQMRLDPQKATGWADKTGIRIYNHLQDIA